MPSSKSNGAKLNCKVKSKNMVKTIPKFFKEDTKEENTQIEIESAYTELSRKLLLDQLEGNSNKGQIYELMTNEYKLRSVMEKKHVSKKTQKNKDKNLCKNKTKIYLKNKNMSSSDGIAHRSGKELENHEVYNTAETNSSRISRIEGNMDWKLQTYDKFRNTDDKFEPIIEDLKDETYETIPNKRIKNKKNRDFQDFYDREMDFVEAKYHYIAHQQAEREYCEVNKYNDLRGKNILMSSRSRKILNNRYKEGIINNNKKESIKISKLFNTPVHERLFIDNEMRK